MPLIIQPTDITNDVNEVFSDSTSFESSLTLRVSVETAAAETPITETEYKFQAHPRKSPEHRLSKVKLGVRMLHTTSYIILRGSADFLDTLDIKAYTALNTNASDTEIIDQDSSPHNLEVTEITSDESILEYTNTLQISGSSITLPSRCSKIKSISCENLLLLDNQYNRILTDLDLPDYKLSDESIITFDRAIYGKLKIQYYERYREFKVTKVYTTTLETDLITASYQDFVVAKYRFNNSFSTDYDTVTEKYLPVNIVVYSAHDRLFVPNTKIYIDNDYIGITNDAGVLENARVPVGKSFKIGADGQYLVPTAEDSLRNDTFMIQARDLKIMNDVLSSSTEAT